MRTLLIAAFTLLIPLSVYGQDKPIVEVRDNLPSGFTGYECYDTGLNQAGNVFIVNTDEFLLKEKGNIASLSSRSNTKKEMEKMTDHAAKLAKQLYDIKYVTLVIMDNYSINIVIAPRFTWDDVEPEIQKVLKGLLCSEEDKPKEEKK